MDRLIREQIAALDPYAFLAMLGKLVIHPGGRSATDRLLEWAGLRPGDRVLDIGCGVGTTPYLGYTVVKATKPRVAYQAPVVG